MATAAEQARQKAERYSQFDPVFEFSPFTAQYIDRATGKFAPAVTGNDASRSGNEQLATARSPQTINQFQKDSIGQMQDALNLQQQFDTNQNAQAENSFLRILNESENASARSSQRKFAAESSRRKAGGGAVEAFPGIPFANISAPGPLGGMVTRPNYGATQEFQRRAELDAFARRLKSKADIQGQIELTRQQEASARRLEQERARSAARNAVVQGVEAQKLARIQAKAQLDAAAIGAQGSIIGGLFNSINSGTPNYRYW